jgi:surface antigen
LLIIFGSIDFAKIVTMSDPSTIKKARKNFFIRLASFIILLFLPYLIRVILSLNLSDYSLNGDFYTCKTSANYYMNRWEVTYVPQVSTSSNSTDASGIVIGGVTNDQQAEALNQDLTNMLHTVYHDRNNPGIMQGGPFPKWWDSDHNGLSKFQCTWWAKGRASQYLEQYGTVYKEYPTEYGNGGDYYSVNKSNGYFKYGQTPKPNSIISWKQGGEAGHVAYVEGVGQDGIYISHAGSGSRWFGVQKISLDGTVWPGSGYSLNGYIYLDEPIQ